MPTETDTASDSTEPTITKPKHRWRRFSLRFLLCLILLSCGGAAYVAHEIRQEIPVALGWNPGTGENIKWSTTIGSQTYSNPTVHGAYVVMGSNNGGGLDPNIPPSIDLGVMLCFEKESGNFLWQHSNRKLGIGRVQDWPMQGVTSQPFVRDGRVWYLSNRCEVVCLDLDGFRDGSNDGLIQDEPSRRMIDADEIWKFDLINRLRVFPHNISHCNVVVDEQFVYVKTCNGVDEKHLDLPAPAAPSFVVLDRDDGRLIWHDKTPGNRIWHGSWGSPKLATIDGRRQILFPGGDGWLYSFDPAGDGKGNASLIWKFDCNPKTASFELGGRGARNNLLTAPTVRDDRVYVTMGQDPEHGGGQSRVWCIEPRGRLGDLSPTLVVGRRSPVQDWRQRKFRHCDPESGESEIPNPKSAAVWEYVGNDINNDGKFDAKGEIAMSRSLSQVILSDDKAYVTDIDGYLHCIDAESGQSNWVYDAYSTVWTSPLVTNDHVYLFDEDGLVSVFRDSANPVDAMTNGAPIFQSEMPSSVYTNATVEDGVIYFASRNCLWAIEDSKTQSDFGSWLRSWRFFRFLRDLN